MDPFNMEVTVRHKQVEFERMRKEGTAFSQFESAASPPKSLAPRIAGVVARIDYWFSLRRVRCACAD